jgi:glycosyltransferase involved in cell wall biosynthesis
MSRRRVLIASYYFPPVASVGSVRAGALAKYLPQHGWDVTIVTPRRPERRTPGPEILETEDADSAIAIKRRLGLNPGLAIRDQLGPPPASSSVGNRFRSMAVEAAKAIVAFPDANRGWVPFAVRAAGRASQQRRFDAVLTTSPPVSAHLAGRRISALLDLPWIADLRDLWSQDHNSTSPPWRRAMDRFLERRTFRHARALVTVSEPLAGQLGQLHTSAKIHTVLNGFDPDLLANNPKLSETFEICHTGTFYQGRRDPSIFFDALTSLLQSGRIDRRRVRVRLFSRQEPWLRREVNRVGLQDVVLLEPWLPWSEALLVQQKAQVLLLLHWGAQAEVGVYTGKIFEYLAAQRPVLMIGGGEGVLSDLLRETRAGVHLGSREEIERQLLVWWEEFERTGVVSYLGDVSRLHRYSHLRMAEEFAGILDSVCSRPQ